MGHETADQEDADHEVITRTCARKGLSYNSFTPRDSEGHGARMQRGDNKKWSSADAWIDSLWKKEVIHPRGSSFVYTGIGACTSSAIEHLRRTLTPALILSHSPFILSALGRHREQRTKVVDLLSRAERVVCFNQSFHRYIFVYGSLWKWTETAMSATPSLSITGFAHLERLAYMRYRQASGSKASYS